MQIGPRLPISLLTLRKEAFTFFRNPSVRLFAIAKNAMSALDQVLEAGTQPVQMGTDSKLTLYRADGVDGPQEMEIN